MLNWVYEQLFHAYGEQHWWPAETRFEICVGAILTQAVSWRNVEQAMHMLRKANLLSLQRMAVVPQETLAQYVRPTRYYNQKAATLQRFCRYVAEEHAGSLDAFLAQDGEILRKQLLSLRGIGEETADSILLYAAEYPIFVVDAYTRRLLVRLGLAKENITYRQMQHMFMTQIKTDTALFNEYHALIVAHGHSTCKARNPHCRVCPLHTKCPASRIVDEM